MKQLVVISLLVILQPVQLFAGGWLQTDKLTAGDTDSSDFLRQFSGNQRKYRSDRC